MSTLASRTYSFSDIECRHALSRLLFELEDELDLLRPEQLATRLTALDELDAILGAQDPEAFATSSDARIFTRAKALRSQFEAANEKLYEAARSEIVQQGSSPTLHRWLMELESDQDDQSPRPGPGFDLRDEIVSGVLQLSEPGEGGLPQSPEMVAYQPTPTRHILDLIAASNLCDEDILVDLGSGLGHVPFVVSILTRSHTLGVEFQPAYVASAQESARNLKLKSVRFVAEDAGMTDLSSGTVFYLFSPFTGSILTNVLQRLLEESKKRQIRICSLGPCTRILKDQAWLEASQKPDTERIAVFLSQ